MPVTTTDLVIVAVYLLGLFAWAIHIGLGETAQDFLVFSRRAPFTLVLFSIVATWVGVGTTVVTAASAYDAGISLGLTACLGGLLGCIGAALYSPRLKAFGDGFGAHTIGDFFAVRYSRASRLAAGSLILVVYLLLTAAQFVGLSALLTVWTGADFRTVVIFAAVSTVIYTAFAGIKSDFFTDMIHFIVMTIVLFIILLPIAVRNVGGFHGFLRLPASHFDPFAYGGVTFFIAGLIFGGGSVFVTMELWQRVYASSSGKAARRALWMAIAIIILFYGVSTTLGMAARLLLPDLPNRDHALFALMSKYLPPGVLGLGLAGFIAILLSTLNSTIMVASATLTKDFWCSLRRHPSDDQRALLTVGRVTTGLSGVAGLLVALALPDLVTLSVNGMFMLLVLLPAIVGGFVWRRATATAALLSVVLGILAVAVFLVVDASIAFVPGFLVSLIAFVVCSLMTHHSQSENLEVVSNWNGESRTTGAREGNVYELR